MEKQKTEGIINFINNGTLMKYKKLVSIKKNYDNYIKQFKIFNL
jgi:hypothetical protein